MYPRTDICMVQLLSGENLSKLNVTDQGTLAGMEVKIPCVGIYHLFEG